MKKQEMIKKYLREAKNLNHNIQFELDKNNNPVWNGETDYKQVEYMRGQLSIIREIIFFLQDKERYYQDLTHLDFKLGYSAREYKAYGIKRQLNGELRN